MLNIIIIFIITVLFSIEFIVYGNSQEYEGLFIGIALIFFGLTGIIRKEIPMSFGLQKNIVAIVISIISILIGVLNILKIIHFK